MIKDDRKIGDAPHCSKDYLACPGLIIDRLPDLPGPDRVTPVVAGMLLDADCVPGAISKTPVTGGTLPGVDHDPVAILPEYTVGAVLNAPLAFHTPLPIDCDPVTKWHAAEVTAHGATLPITGSPAAGMVIDSTFGSIARIAASSLDI